MLEPDSDVEMKIKRAEIGLKEGVRECAIMQTATRWIDSVSRDWKRR